MTFIDRIAVWLYQLSVAAAIRLALKKYGKVILYHDDEKVLPRVFASAPQIERKSIDSFTGIAKLATGEISLLVVTSRTLPEKVSCYLKELESAGPYILHSPSRLLSGALEKLGKRTVFSGYATECIQNRAAYKSERLITTLSSNACDVSVSFPPLLLIAIFCIFMAMKFSMNETLPADDLARHAKAFLYNYDFRGLFVYSYHPSFNTYYSFDLLASFLYRLAGEKAYLVLQILPLVLTFVAIWKMTRDAGDNMACLSVLLVFYFTWARFVSGRPCILVSSLFLVAYAFRDDLPAAAHFAIGLLLSSMYYLYFLYTVPLAIAGTGDARKGFRIRLAYAAATAAGLIFWYVYSHAEYFVTLTSLFRTAFVFRRIEYSELKPIFPGGLVTYFAALLPLLLYFRRNVRTAFLAVYFMMFNQLRFFETIVPLSASFLRHATFRGGVLLVCGALSLALLQVHGVPHRISAVPEGSTVLTSSSVAMNSVVMASQRVGVVPSPNLGWNEPGIRDAVEQMTAEGSLDCSLFARYSFDYVVEDRLKQIPQCLELRGLEGGYRIWKVKLEGGTKDLAQFEMQ